MSDSRSWEPWIVGAIILTLVAYVGYLGWIMSTCEGHVLRNALNWPVCVEGVR